MVMRYMRFLKNKKGFTLLELIVAMVVLVLLGAMVGGLVKTGLSSYTHISSDMEYETEARTAMSLITVQIRKHDQTGAIAVDSVNKKLTFFETPSLPASSAGSVIRFDSDDNILYSQTFNSFGDITSYGTESKIAAISGLMIQQGVDEHSGSYIYTIRITYGQTDNPLVLEQTVTQRSAAE